MEILNNKEVKKIWLISIATVLLFAIILVIITVKQNNDYKSQINKVVFSIVGTIKQEYPDIDEEKIIKILNGKGDSKIGLELLNQYGINEKTVAIQQLEKQAKINIVLNLAILVIAESVLIIVFYSYLRYRQRKIDEITDYVERISNKNYTLGIEENSEDELTRLKNELYKITVMLKEEAENSTKTKEALATSVSDISHQLKTPLTSILILLDNLSQSDNMEKQTREKFINEISRQVEGMNWLVISLLKLSRLDAGVVEFSNTAINVNELIKDVNANLEIMAELKNVSFKINSNKECYFYGDYNWNKEAIQNIVKNAIEHTKENTSIIIITEENNVYTQISIEDKGNGIDEENIKHIFDRFYKSQNVSENSFGIGLSLAKSIIERQNRIYRGKFKKRKRHCI